MWNGKKKAVTFSFDDGVTQDARCIELFNKYGLKGTFNINSELLGREGTVSNGVRTVSHDKIPPELVEKIYVGHEVAVHTLTHPLLPLQSDEEVIRQVEEDRKKLSELCGYEVVGMAYPGGGENADDRVERLIRQYTGVKYARENRHETSFDLPKNPYRFNGVYFGAEDFEQLVDAFLALETDKPQMLYIWGHTYEMDFGGISWERFEGVCQRLSNKSDIFYGTNKEVLL